MKLIALFLSLVIIECVVMQTLVLPQKTNSKKDYGIFVCAEDLAPIFRDIAAHAEK